MGLAEPCKAETESHDGNGAGRAFRQGDGALAACDRIGNAIELQQRLRATLPRAHELRGERGRPIGIGERVCRLPALEPDGRAVGERIRMIRVDREGPLEARQGRVAVAQTDQRGAASTVGIRESRTERERLGPHAREVDGGPDWCDKLIRGRHQAVARLGTGRGR